MSADVAHLQTWSEIVENIIVCQILGPSCGHRAQQAEQQLLKMGSQSTLSRSYIYATPRNKFGNSK